MSEHNPLSQIPLGEPLKPEGEIDLTQILYALNRQKVLVGFITITSIFVSLFYQVHHQL